MKNISPILITGTFRSGTTLISQIIRNHKEIELVYDSVNFMRFSYDRYNPISEIKNAKKLLEEVHNRIIKRWNMHFSIEEVLNKLKDKEISYSSIYNGLMNSLLLKNNESKIWGEKTTLVWKKIPDFFEMFPNSRVIHIIRDPRAVLASWKKMTDAPKDDYLDAIINCRSSMECALKYKEKYKNKRYSLIKFEDIVSFPEKYTKKICEKLDIEFNTNMLDTNSFTNKSGDSWKNNSMFDKKIKGISTKTVNLWKSKLENWEIWLSDFTISELMKEYDYETLNINISENELEKIKNKIASSPLLTDGFLNYLFTNKGLERFPKNPLNSRNWEK